jgi:hypothetical protein
METRVAQLHGACLTPSRFLKPLNVLSGTSPPPLPHPDPVIVGCSRQQEPSASTFGGCSGARSWNARTSRTRAAFSLGQNVCTSCAQRLYARPTDVNTRPMQRSTLDLRLRTPTPADVNEYPIHLPPYFRAAADVSGPARLRCALQPRSPHDTNFPGAQCGCPACYRL